MPSKHLLNTYQGFGAQTCSLENKFNTGNGNLSFEHQGKTELEVEGMQLRSSVSIAERSLNSKF